MRLSPVSFYAFTKEIDLFVRVQIHLLVREGQLLVQGTEFCLPDKECCEPDEENPCCTFRKMPFPI